MNQKIILLLILLTFTNIFAFEYDLKLSQSDLQRIIEKKFPYEKKKFMSYVKIFNPTIILKDNSKKIFIASNIKINLLEQFNFDTSSLLSGVLKFDNKTNDFYLGEFKVEELDLRELPKELQELSIQNIEKLVKLKLEKEPIYHLDKKKLGTIASKFEIKEIKVEDKHMIISLELF
jgi:hypothetical protein